MIQFVYLQVEHHSSHPDLVKTHVGNVLGDGACYFDESVSESSSPDRDLLAEVLLAFIGQDPLVHVELLVKDRVLVLATFKQAHLGAPDHFYHVVVLSLWLDELLEYTVLGYLPVSKKVNEFFLIEEFKDSIVLGLSLLVAVWLFFFVLSKFGAFRLFHLLNDEVSKVELFLLIHLSKLIIYLKSSPFVSILSS